MPPEPVCMGFPEHRNTFPGVARACADNWVIAKILVNRHVVNFCWRINTLFPKQNWRDQALSGEEQDLRSRKVTGWVLQKNSRH